MAIKDNKYRGLQKYEDGSWGVDCRIRGQRYRHKCGTLTEARDFYAELKRRERLGEVLPIDDGPPPKRTVGEWLDTYAELLGPKERSKNQPDLLHVAMWKDLFGEMLPEHVTEEIIAEWVRRRPEQSHGYKRRQLSVLRRVFTFAIQAREVEGHPFHDWRRLGLPKKLNNRRQTYLTIEQEVDFFRELDRRWWPYAEFAILTGMRWGDQFGLRRANVDLEKGIIVVLQSKHGESQSTVLSEHLVRLLTALLASHSSDWVFPSPTGKRWGQSNFRIRHWRPALERAGIPSDFCWHSLRHTAASRLVEDGEDLYTVMEHLGQKDIRTTQHYAHLRDEKRKKAAERLAKGRQEIEQRRTAAKSTDEKRTTGKTDGKKSKVPSRFARK